MLMFTHRNQTNYKKKMEHSPPLDPIFPKDLVSLDVFWSNTVQMFPTPIPYPAQAVEYLILPGCI